MIQDLEGLKFDNQFYNIQPCEEDIILCVKGNELLMKGEPGVIEYPQLKDVPDEQKMVTITENGKTRQTVRKFRYLFSIDEEKYFLTMDMELEGYRYEPMLYMRSGGPKKNAYAGLVALQLGRWYASRQYCGRCGSKMHHDEVERMMKCPNCRVMEFPKICPCVIVGVINNGKILVSQYKHGAKDHYALIAGFAEMGETIEECVAREVYEEAHVRVKNLRYYKSQPWPFSESLLFGFFCELDGDDTIVIDESELRMAKWAEPKDLWEGWNDYSITNEMISKFKFDYEHFGKLNWEEDFPAVLKAELEKEE